MYMLVLDPMGWMGIETDISWYVISSVRTAKVLDKRAAFCICNIRVNSIQCSWQLSRNSDDPVDIRRWRMMPRCPTVGCSTRFNRNSERDGRQDEVPKVWTHFTVQLNSICVTGQSRVKEVTHATTTSETLTSATHSITPGDLYCA